MVFVAGAITWKVVWKNGEEAYVQAPSRDAAQRVARAVRDVGTVPVIYCERYGASPRERTA